MSAEVVTNNKIDNLERLLTEPKLDGEWLQSYISEIEAETDLTPDELGQLALYGFEQGMDECTREPMFWFAAKEFLGLILQNDLGPNGKLKALEQLAEELARAESAFQRRRRWDQHYRNLSTGIHIL